MIFTFCFKAGGRGWEVPVASHIFLRGFPLSLLQMENAREQAAVAHLVPWSVLGKAPLRQVDPELLRAPRLCKEHRGSAPGALLWVPGTGRTPCNYNSNRVTEEETVARCNGLEAALTRAAFAKPLVPRSEQERSRERDEPGYSQHGRQICPKRNGPFPDATKRTRSASPSLCLPVILSSLFLC